MRNKCEDSFDNRAIWLETVLHPAQFLIQVRFHPVSHLQTLKIVDVLEVNFVFVVVENLWLPLIGLEGEDNWGRAGGLLVVGETGRRLWDLKDQLAISAIEVPGNSKMTNYSHVALVQHGLVLFTVFGFQRE